MNRNANNKDTAFLFILNHNIGQNYFMLGDIGKALDYYRHAHSLLLASSKPNPDYKALSYTSLGTLYLKRGNWKQAEIMLNRALEFAREAGMKGKECDIWYQLFGIYEGTGRFAEACRAIRQYEVLYEELNMRSGIQEVQRMKYQMELNGQRQQAEIERQKSELKQTVLWIILLSVTLLLILIVFVLSVINHRRRLSQIANEQLAGRLEKEEMRNQLQQIEHKRSIDEKQREIATANLLITEKSALLEQLSDTFKPY